MRRVLVVVSLLASLATPAFAAVAVEELGAHRLGTMDEFQQVIDTRVITSYSIHYTKLYDKRRSVSWYALPGKSPSAWSWSASPCSSAPGTWPPSAPPDTSVITSYSIHYTKLYER